MPLELGLRWRLPGGLARPRAAFTMDKHDVILRDSAGFNVSGGTHAPPRPRVRRRLGTRGRLALSAASGTLARHEYRFTAAVEQGEQITSGNDIDTAPRDIHALRLQHDAAMSRCRTRMALSAPTGPMRPTLRAMAGTIS